MIRNDREKPLIMVVCDYYLPGYKSGGAMRTIVNMIDRLGDQYDFRIVTRDHDGVLDRTPYSGVSVNSWNRAGRADVYYLSRNNVRRSVIGRLVETLDPDLIYANSFFATPTIFLLTLRLTGRIQTPIVLAPEGELSEGALSIKPLKKKIYIQLFKLLNRVNNIVWKAASEEEAEDIQEVANQGQRILIAPNLSPVKIFENYEQGAKPIKTPGIARMVFLSRFVPKKNFNWLLEQLGTVNGELHIDILGPLEDKEYWKECQDLISQLPADIIAEAKGSVDHHEVVKALFGYHFFVLPTLSENFGHIFVEALAAGCPLITSDRTPWLGLENKGIGWDIPLEEPRRWREVIDRCIRMDNDEYVSLSERARGYSLEYLADKSLEEKTREVLEFGLKQTIEI